MTGHQMAKDIKGSTLLSGAGWDQLTAPAAPRSGCGSRPELLISSLHTASLARPPYGSCRRRVGEGAAAVVTYV